jgi:hypothetical protein
MRIPALAALVAVGVFGGQASASDAAGAIWSGNSGGLTITWTSSNITASQNGKQVFSARAWAEAGLRHFISANRTAGTASPPACDYTRTLRIVSIVGPMVSFEDATEFTCTKEAHPGGMTRLITLDLSSRQPLVEAGHDAIGRVDPERPGKAVLLTRLFPAEQIFKALSALPPIQSALRSAGSQPQTLPALVQAVSDSTGEGENCYIIPPDLLASFAFDRVEDGRVVIRLGLPGDGPCRMKLTSFDMRFAVPSQIAGALQAAAAGKEGFLAAEGSRIVAGRSTKITLRSGGGRELR